ncbi:MAG: gamma-mobile-trio protein GmtX [Pseudomonadota bacterium]
MSENVAHPDDVLSALLEKGFRSDKVEKLKRLHELCAAEYGQRRPGLRDFSIAHVARLAEKAGLFKAKTMYNKQSSDYVVLVASWERYTGPTPAKHKKDIPLREKYDFVLKIEDPAIRTLVQLALTQRDKLKVQLDTLKSQANITLDLRPLGTFPVKGSKPSTIERPAQLTESERGALLQAISPEFIQSQNWHIGESGEVRASNGRFVFDPGFATAIRKILGNDANAGDH